MNDFCICDMCADPPNYPECPECDGAVYTESSPSIDGAGYGHTVYVCDSRSCEWWDG